jgi:NAD-dependent dihydropyrimidine dehydrogenase PreA subunit
MSRRPVLADVRDTLLRMLPHRAPTGLTAIGRPGRDAPVLVTGNYALTVRRLRHALMGRDVWLLVADSRGINVWCAAGGGHFTHHDVIAAVRAARLEGRVDHRELVLPQLSATGVERRRIEEATGFRVRWGPARSEDLGAYLERGRRVVKRERSMRFPLRERLEMALVWGWPALLMASGVSAWLVGWRAAAGTALAVAASVTGLYAAVPRLPLAGRRRWAVFGAFAAAGAALGGLALIALGAVDVRQLLVVVGVVLVAVAALAVDFEGTTPWYASALATAGHARVELAPERCSGAADCVQVCPRDVLRMDGRQRKVVIARPDACIRCAACIVQCPEDALRFRFDDGSLVEASTIRRTRLNMLGRRTVEVPESRV